jgi:hypothetical protein
LRPPRPVPFHFVGRTFALADSYLLTPTTISADAAGGVGIIACWRPTTSQARAFGYARSGSSQNVKYGRSTTGKWAIRNSAAVDIMHSATLSLSTVYVTFAYSRSATDHWLAVGGVNTLENSTTSMSLFESTSLSVGVTDGTGNQGDFVGDFFWLGALKAFPALGPLHSVLAQQAPPTILSPWLAHLIPFQGIPFERCILTGRAMTAFAGTPGISTVRIPKPQVIQPGLDDGLGRGTKRYYFGVSYNGNNFQEISTTVDAALPVDTILLQIPSGSDRVMGIALNGRPAVTATLPADANAQSGDLLIGSRMSAGAATNDAVTGSLMAALASVSEGAGAGDALLADAKVLLAPIISTTSFSGPAATSLQVDLGTYIKDPSGSGYTATLDGASAGLTASLLGTVLDYRAETAGTYTATVTLRGMHPFEPTVTVALSITISDAGTLYPNGYKYRRLITRPAQTSVTAGTRTRFPVPIRIVEQAWARGVGFAGKLEASPAIDIHLEDTAGNPIPFELRPGSSLVDGNHTIIVQRDTNPASADTFYLYYGKVQATSTENPAAVWSDYYYVYGGGTDERNAANGARPWDVSDVTSAPGNLGFAGNFAPTTAEVSRSVSDDLNGLTELDVTIHLRRQGTGGTGGGGANGYEYVASVTLPAWSGGSGNTPNFLLPFNVAGITSLKTVANGGRVRSSSGWDIRFETTTGTKLPHKLVHYDGSTGTVVALVNMARNFVAGETIRIYVGNASLTASEEDPVGARAGGWLAWYCGSATDLTGQGRNFTETGSPPSTFLMNWPGKALNGSSQYFGSSGTASWLNGLSALTAVSFQALSGMAGEKYEVFNVSNGSTETFLSLHHNNAGNFRYTVVAKFGTAASVQYQSQNGTASARATAVRVQASQPITMAGDGFVLPAGTAATPGSGSTTISDNLEWGRGGRGDLEYWDGTVAFLGFCSRAMSDTEMACMTAAFDNGALFNVYTLGSFAANT